MKSVERMTTTPPAGAASADRSGPVKLAVAVLLVYTVLLNALPRYFTPPRVGLSVGILLPLVLALGGWLTARTSPVLRAYALAAVLVSAWTMLCAVAAWNGKTLYDSAAFVAWFVVIVPGLAFLMRARVYRWAFAFGFIAAMTTYGLVVLYRVVVGDSVLDVQPTGELVSGGWILGRNRNLVSMGAMVALPLLLEKVGPRLIVRLRWPLIAVCGASVLYGGGRAGLLGLGALGLLHALLRRNATRRARQLVAIGLLGWLFLLMSQSIGGPIGVATDRLLDYFAGERDHSAEVRELVVRKAWHITVENPVFGVGYMRFQITHHPVIEEADDHDVYRDAQRATAHMTYAQAFAELGFPGGAAFVALIAVLLVMGARRNHDRDVRATTVSFGAVAVMVAFDAVLGGAVLFLPMAMLLGSLFAAEDTAPSAVTS